MVAEHDIGELQRSLIRVPGSGYNYLSDGTRLLNLGVTSGIAAAIPFIPLPAALNNTPVSPPPPPPPPPMNNKLMNLDAAIRAGIISHDDGTLKIENKKYKIIMMTPDELQKNTTRLVPIVTPYGNVLKLTKSLPSESLPSSQSSEKKSLMELIHNVNVLKRDNEILQKRLSVFQQLFKNKNRLKSLVKRLDVK